MVLYVYVVSHNARNAGTVSCIRLYHTADAKTTAENLKDIIHMDSSVLVLSLAAKYEQQILDNVLKGAALHKLLGVTLYFSPQRAVLEPPPSYEPLAQNQSETPVNTSGMRVRNDSNDLAAYSGTIVPGPSVQVIPGPSEQIIPGPSELIIPGPSIQVIPEHQPGQQVLPGPVDIVQGPVYYQGQSYFGTPYPYINPQSLNPNDPNLVPNFPPLVSQHMVNIRNALLLFPLYLLAQKLAVSWMNCSRTFSLCNCEISTIIPFNTIPSNRFQFMS